MAALPRANGRGTAFIRRGFCGIWIRRASGTNDPDVFARYIAMLTDLGDRNERTLLRQIAAGEVTVGEVYDAYVIDKKAVAGGVHTELASKAIDAWLGRSLLAETTLRGYRASLRTLLAQGHPDTTVAQLPALLEAARTAAEVKKHGRSWNNCWMVARAFLRSAYNKRDPTYLALLALEPLATVRHPVRAKLTPSRFRALLEPLEPGRRALVWAMATTGMGPKEFWLDGWSVLPDRVTIHGQKREQRERDVPWVDSLAGFERMRHWVKRTQPDGVQVRQQVGWPGTRDEAGKLRPVPTAWNVHRHLRAASSKQVEEFGLTRPLELYDCRRHFDYWLQLAEIPRTRRILYFGHEGTDVHALYEAYEVTEFLAADGAALRWVLEHDSLDGFRARGRGRKKR